MVEAKKHGCRGVEEAHEHVSEALRQISDLLIFKMYRFIDAGPCDGQPIELLTRAQATKIELRLGALVDMLSRPAPFDEEGKMLLGAALLDLLASVNTASHGVSAIIAFLEKSKAAALARERAAVMREPKERSDSENRLRLIQAIQKEAVYLKTEVAISEKFAGKVRPGVRGRLGLKPDGKGWPEIGTIKAAARHIK